MGKENNAVSGRFRDYPAAALFLAGSYGNMLKERAYIEDVLSGKYEYTKDDALAELIRTTASTESDTGVRVQTSNISNTTERIGILLADGFVEKRNREILREILDDTDGRIYLHWKLDVVETAMRERMDSMERAIFKRLFVKHMTYKQIREAYHKKTLYNRDVSTYRKNALSMLEKEIRLREGTSEDGAAMADRLFKEAREDEAYGNNG